MNIRVLTMTTASGERERIHITEDFDTPADDFCAAGFSIDVDEEVDADNWPTAFPMDYTFERIT